MFRFVKTTVFGGVVFLIPIVVIAFILGKAFVISRKISKPFVDLIDFGPVTDALIVETLAILLLILVCFAAGMAARSALFVKLIEPIESKVLSNIPIYQLAKETISSALHAEEQIEGGMIPVLARFDDCWQIAFEVERIAGGMVAVFLPGSPHSTSGTVCLMSEDRISPLNAKRIAVMGSLKGYGKGCGAFFKAPAAES